MRMRPARSNRFKEFSGPALWCPTAAHHEGTRRHPERSRAALCQGTARGALLNYPAYYPGSPLFYLSDLFLFFCIEKKKEKK